MGFGSTFNDLVESAGGTARDAARGVATWTREKVEAGYAAAKTAAGHVRVKATEAGADTLGVTKATAQKADTAVAAAKEKVRSVRKGIGNAVDKVFGREPAAPPAETPTVAPCPVAEAERKRTTRQERKALIAKGKASGDPNLRKSAENLERDMDAVEEAKLSNHIYCIHDPAECNEDTRPVPGFKDVSNDPRTLAKLGLTKADLNSPGSNFRAAVFERQNPPFSEAEAGYVVVFKGTSSGNVEDWRNNFRQGLDVHSDYYRRAVGIGKSVARATRGPGSPAVGFAGHSLGGGLASAAASAGGKRGNTFNAAGLHPNTVQRYGGIPGDRSGIHAYNVPGDPLTETNIHGVTVGGYKVSSPPLAAGTGQRLDRALSDTDIPPGKDDTYFHSMPVVVRAIERRKAADQERLQAAAPATP